MIDVNTELTCSQNNIKFYLRAKLSKKQDISFKKIPSVNRDKRNKKADGYIMCEVLSGRLVDYQIRI